MEGASILLRNSQQVVRSLAQQLESQALWVNAEYEEDMWECVALLCHMGSSLEIARGLLLADAISAEQHVGSVLESCVLGRGLLYNSLALGIRMGVIGDEAEVTDYCKLLDPRAVEPVEVIVAYLDYLDTTDDMDENFGSTYSMIARRFADGLPSFPWSSYYWTSSDTYCIFGVLGSGDIPLRIASFVNDLVWVQRNQHVRMEHVGWMWQIGVTIAKARVIGDVIIPSRESVMAATLMKRAKLENKGGGLILVDSAVVKRVDAEGLQELLLLVRGDDPLVGITLQTIGKEGRLNAYALRQVLAINSD